MTVFGPHHVIQQGHFTVLFAGGDAILQAFLRRDLLDVQLIVYIVHSERQGLKMECCWEQQLWEYIYPQPARATLMPAWPADLGLGH